MTQTFKRFQQGFTVIEVAVVVAVLAVLASIIFVSYSSYREDARDVQRKSDLQNIASAIKAYGTWKGNFVETDSGCGVDSDGAGGTPADGNGWLTAGPGDLGASLYPRSIVQCLQDAKVLKEGDFLDPTGCTWDAGGICGSWNGVPAKAYMKATCTKGGVKKTYVFGHLEGVARSDAAIDALCDANTVTGFTSDGQKWGTHYGMNYYIEIQ
ncbi:MAG TPA: prepilin-type N-terminal cleavage/methylation domain-containing protein [Candidatus Saccharimonadales bacterium]